MARRLRIQEALALAEGDLDHGRGALLVRWGKGGRRREVGMDAWGWDELQPWLELRVELPVGPLFCVINGRTRGRQWSSAGARTELRRTAVSAGVRRRFAPHQLRHADALSSEQVSFSWRRMPPDTGGRGSYGHRHPGQEEVYFVISGKLTFKVGDHILDAGPQTAVRMTGDEFYSVHNDTDTESELLIFSTRLADAPIEKLDGFWPTP